MRDHTKLNLHNLEPPLLAEFLPLMAACIQLESIELYYGIEVPLPELVSFFRPISVLPSLRHLNANGQYRTVFLWFTWEFGKPLECEIEELTHGFREITQVRTAIIHSAEPPKDLTREGIEPNPGPSALFTELFTDGILSIFSYLTLGELNSVSRLNKQIHDLIRSGRMRSDITFVPDSTNLACLPISPNSLSRYVRRLIASGNFEFPYHSIQPSMNIFPGLTEFHIQSTTNPSAVDQYGVVKKQLDDSTITFPRGLRSIKLHTYGWDDRIFLGLSKCDSLTSLTYRYTGYMTGKTPLFSLPLKILHIEGMGFTIESNNFSDLLRSIQETIEILRVFAPIQREELKRIYMPQLQVCEIEFAYDEPGAIQSILTSVPNLTKLSPMKFFIPDFPLIKSFRKLTFLGLTSAISGEISSQIFWSTLNECDQLRKLFLSWIPKITDNDPPFFSRPIMRRVTTLDLYRLRPQLPLIILPNIAECEQLEVLSLYDVVDATIDQICEILLSSHVLPLLDRFFAVDRRSNVFQWTRSEGIDPTYMTGATPKHIREGFRVKTTIIQDGNAAHDPIKDLTREGIEPNPGPSDAFDTLFTDGVLTILSYLTLSELNSISQVDHEFLDLIHSDRTKSIFLFQPTKSQMLLIPDTPPEHSIRLLVSRFITIGDFPIGLLKRMLDTFPRLTEFHFDSAISFGSDLDLMKLQSPNIIFNFPHTLRTIHLDVSRVTINVDGIFRGLKDCRQLTSIIYIGRLIETHVFTPIFGLPLIRFEAKALSSQSVPSVEHGLDLLQSISNTIEILSLPWLVFPSSDQSEFYFPRIQHFDVNISLSREGDLDRLLAIAPNIQILQPHDFYLPDLPRLASVPTLTEFHLRSHGNGHIASDALWNAFDSCHNLRSLRLVWIPRPDPSEPFIRFSRPCMRRIISLNLNLLRSLLPPELLLELVLCVQLEYLTIMYSFDCTFPLLVTTFHSIDTLPHLRSIYLVGSTDGPLYSQLKLQWKFDAGTTVCSLPEMAIGFREVQPMVADVAAVDPQKDLTREGIEPNPGPVALLTELFTGVSKIHITKLYQYDRQEEERTRMIEATRRE